MSVSLPSPAETPLYKISCYRDNFFKVTKRLYTPSPVRVKKPEEFRHNDEKLDCALARSRSSIREYALCNDWEYFFTFTIDGEKHERYDLKPFLQELLQWFQNLRKSKYPQLKYLLVPDQHEDGAWHFHGMISGIPAAPLPDWAPYELRERGDQEWTEYRLRYGWCSLSPIRNPVGASFYVTKYITNKVARFASDKGLHTYYHTRGLRRSLPVGYLYHGVRILDEVCKHSNSFYSWSYFSLKDLCLDDFGHLVDMCDEVCDMYKSYVLTDPETEEIVAVLGGEEDDAEIQYMLSEFLRKGFLPLPDAMPA